MRGQFVQTGGSPGAERGPEDGAPVERTQRARWADEQGLGVARGDGCTAL